MALFVIGDVHGFLAPVTAALRDAGLVDADGHWSGGEHRLWFLGDLTDRGPHGLAVIDLVRRLQGEAAVAGGEVGCVIGNHDMLLYGSKRVPDSPVTDQRTVIQVWALNGGQEDDLAGLDDERAEWLAGLPAVVLAGDQLLIHADTVAYLEFGSSIEEINTAVRRFVGEPDPAEFGGKARLLFRRFEFLDPEHGLNNAKGLLAALGGRRIVHGHSTIPETFGVAAEAVDGPVAYADGLALAVDTGLALGARCVVVKLMD